MLKRYTTLTPEKSVTALSRILSRIHLFTLAQELQKQSLPTHDLLYTDEWVVSFFEFINENYFPVHNEEAWDEDDDTLFNYIYISSPLGHYYDHDPDEFAGAYRFGILAHSQNDEFSDLPPYYEINSDGWKFIEEFFNKLQSPFKHFYQLFSAIDKSSGNWFWDYNDEGGDLIPWTTENISQLKSDYQQLQQDESHFEELTEWLAKKANYKKAVKIWKATITHAHELFPRPPR